MPAPKNATRTPTKGQWRRDPFFGVAFFCSITVVVFIVLPLAQMILQPSPGDLWKTIHDPDVLRSIWLSIYTSGLASLISFIVGTPFAYLLARRDFSAKRLIESIVDIPIMIPHPIIGIAILSLAGKNHWLGRFMQDVGIHLMSTVTGIVTVLTFVGLPFYVNTVKSGFEAVPPRLEHVSRSLGASLTQTFFRVTFPLTWRSMMVGLIMCCARAISEFGAIIIVAYHPMTAPVLIYERFTAYGLKYSQPVAVWLIVVCLVLFLLLRVASTTQEKSA